MKILITILLLIPLNAYATYEQLDLIFTLQEMWVFTDGEVFDLIFNDILWLK